MLRTFRQKFNSQSSSLCISSFENVFTQFHSEFVSKNPFPSFLICNLDWTGNSLFVKIRSLSSKTISSWPPKFLLSWIGSLHARLNGIQKTLSPEFHLARHALGFIYSKSLFVVCHLKVADALDHGPKTAEQLAEALNVNSDRLCRILRMLAQVGIFQEHPDKTFSNSKISEILQENHPHSQRPWILHLTFESYQTADELLATVTTGQPSVEIKFGKSIWDYYAEHPDLKENFAKAMQALDPIQTPLLIESYDWRSVGTVADVGGSLGTFLEAVLRENPQSKGILFDLPEVVEVSKQQPRWKGDLAARVEFVEGSFFESVPVADTYILRSDESSVKILQTIRKAIPPGGRVLICDLIQQPFGKNPDNFFRVTALDTLMMINCEGKERTEEEFDQLFTQSGFRLKKVHRTKGAIAIMEGVSA